MHVSIKRLKWGDMVYKYLVLFTSILVSVVLIMSVHTNFAILLGICPALFYGMKTYESAKQKRPIKNDLFSTLLILIVVPIAFLIVISR